MVLNLRGPRRCRHALKSRRYRCLLNGRDVTKDCFYADGRRGIVRRYALGSDGRKFAGRDGKLATYEKRGHVRLVRGEAR